MRTRSSASSMPSARPGLGRGVLVALVALLAAACSSWTPDSAPAATTAATSAAPTTSAPSSSAAAPAATGDLARAHVRLQEVARLESPVGMALRKGDSGTYFIEQTGRVRVLRNGRMDPNAVLDVSGQVKAGGEQGLLGIAFSPDGRYLYLDFTDSGGDTRIAEFAMRGDRPDPASQRSVLTVDQPLANHTRGRPAPSPTASRGTTPSSTGRVLARRSGTTACATRGGSVLTPPPGTYGSPTSARATGRRSTTSRPDAAGATTAGTGWRAPTASTGTRRPERSRRSSSTTTTAVPAR